jgi:hypothetical protein
MPANYGLGKIAGIAPSDMHSPHSSPMKKKPMNKRKAFNEALMKKKISKKGFEKGK